MCRPCHAEYHHEHYVANKKRYVRQARERKAALREERTRYLFEYFAENPCSDCGESDPMVLEFDHLDSKKKSFNIGPALSYRNWEIILEEIKKCHVVCANCHRRRTARRMRSIRSILAEQTD